MGAINSDEQAPNSNFKDIDKSSNPTLLGKAVSLGITSGYQDGTVKPKGTLTRAEAVAIINRVFAPSSSTKDLSKFKDIKKGAWYYNEISKALK